MTPIEIAETALTFKPDADVKLTVVLQQGTQVVVSLHDRAQGLATECWFYSDDARPVTPRGILREIARTHRDLLETRGIPAAVLHFVADAVCGDFGGVDPMAN